MSTRIPSGADRLWWIAGSDGVTHGPIDLPTATEWIRLGHIGSQTWVSPTDGAEWISASQDTQLSSLFDSAAIAVLPAAENTKTYSPAIEILAYANRADHGVGWLLFGFGLFFLFGIPIYAFTQVGRIDAISIQTYYIAGLIGAPFLFLGSLPLLSNRSRRYVLDPAAGVIDFRWRTFGVRRSRTVASFQEVIGIYVEDAGYTTLGDGNFCQPYKVPSKEYSFTATYEEQYAAEMIAERGRIKNARRREEFYAKADPYTRHTWISYAELRDGKKIELGRYPMPGRDGLRRIIGRCEQWAEVIGCPLHLDHK